MTLFVGIPLVVRGSSFDTTCVTLSDLGISGYASYDYNALTNASEEFHLGAGGDHDVVVSGGFNWQSSSFGNYYLPGGSPLIAKGDVTANLVGLYYFTTQTSQAPEGDSQVDIGYHYVATDGYGNPLADGTGQPYYLDAGNGNIVEESGELSGAVPPIQFTIAVANQYVNNASVPLQLTIQSGVPYYCTVMLDSTDFSAASWTPYTSSTIAANLGTAQGWHTVWVGLCGQPSGPAGGALQTWNAIRLNLDLTAPVLVVTNATTVTVPVLQLGGYTTEPLSSISYSLDNAAGFVANQQALVTDQYYDMSIGEFTTNYFACLDIPLTIGLNVITLQATDMAGNVTVSSFNFTLDYSAKAAPTVDITWPPDGALVSGSSFTCRGQISDPTASLTASVVDTNGNTDIYTGAVDRDGNFWLEDLPLNAGTNAFSITVTDVLGNSNVACISIVQSALALTMNDMSLDPQLWQPTVNVSGTISDPTYTVWGNGMQGNNNGDGTWSANNVQVDPGLNASFDVTAYAPGQTQPAGAVSSDPVKPSRVYVSRYVETNSLWADTMYLYAPGNGWLEMIPDVTNLVNWSDGSTGYGYQASFDNMTGNEVATVSGLRIAASPTSSWPSISVGTASNLVNGSFYYEQAWTPPITFEHCDIPVPLPNCMGGYVDATCALAVMNTGQRYAQATIRLETGGIRGSKAQNLFVINCSAADQRPTVSQPPSGPNAFAPPGAPTPIPPQSIAIGTLGNLGADGNLYVLLPDNTNVDITPTVSGRYYFTFVGNTGDPVAAPKYPLHIFFNGTDVTGSNITVFVGQQINLTCSLMGSGAPTMSSVSWKVPGITFSNYEPNAQTGTLYTNFPTNNSRVTFYWVDGGTKQLSCTATAAGQTCPAQTTFTVTRPTAQMSATVTGQIAADSNFNVPGPQLHFGGVLVGTNFVAGIKFQIHNVDSNGTYFFVQTGSVHREHLSSNGTNYVGLGGPGIDDGSDRGNYVYLLDPSQGTNATGDSPGTPTPSYDTQTSASDSFTMYLMFTPSNVGVAEPVPLQKMDWSWSATASQTNAAMNLWNVTTSNPPSGLSPANTTVHPQWTTNMIDSVHWTP